MYHSAPNAFGLIAVRQGGSVILQPRFNAEDLLQLIERRTPHAARRTPHAARRTPHAARRRGVADSWR
jgi:long-chain acyl-CoA synthetase